MPTENKIQILLADDQEIVRLGVKTLIAGTEIKIAAEAATGKAATKLATEKHFDLVLLSLNLPDSDGLAVLSRIKLDKPELPVILLSAPDNRSAISKAMARGASGHLPTDFNRDELLATIRAVAAGDKVWGTAKVRKTS